MLNYFNHFIAFSADFLKAKSTSFLGKSRSFFMGELGVLFLEHPPYPAGGGLNNARHVPWVILGETSFIDPSLIIAVGG